MCFIDTTGMTRRGFLGGGLAAGAAMAAGVGRSLLLPGVAEGAETPGASGGPGAAGVRFKWFGTNGWEISFGNKTILIDPWLNRFESGFLQNKLNHDALLPTDTSLIDQHVKKADQILVGHGHWDHMADVPAIAKKTGAMVVGSETHANVMRAAGVPECKIVQVKATRSRSSRVCTRWAAPRSTQFPAIWCRFRRRRPPRSAICRRATPSSTCLSSAASSRCS
jgi:Beta-lactamase superfamily domain